MVQDVARNSLDPATLDRLEELQRLAVSEKSIERFDLAVCDAASELLATARQHAKLVAERDQAYAVLHKIVYSRDEDEDYFARSEALEMLAKRDLLAKQKGAG